MSDKPGDERVYRIVSRDAQQAGQNEVNPAGGVDIMTASVSELEYEIAHLRDLDLHPPERL